MCKHKSGGMSKSSGTDTQDSPSERTTPFSSQDCPQSSSEVPGGAPELPAPSQEGARGPLIRNYSVTTVINMQPPTFNGSSSICDTYNFLPDAPRDSKYGGASFVPNLRGGDFLEPQDSEEEDTERSPMLLKESLYCGAPPPWHPNILTEEERNLDSTRYSGRDAFSGLDRREKTVNCDNFPMYHKYRTRAAMPFSQSYMPAPFPGGYVEKAMNNFDELPDHKDQDYALKHKKKWMLSHKCKSADSEPDSFSGRVASACRKGASPVSYNYGQSTNVLATHMDCNSYANKSLFSGNGDPVAGPSGLQRPCSINWEMGVNSVDSEFRSRSYSLTPTINFAVFESGSSSEAEDVPEQVVPESVEVVALGSEVNIKSLEDPFELPVMSLGKVLSISPSAAQLSIASSYGDNGSPICKICHMTAKENDPLISPCRCSGTMQYIHCGCLMRWLEVCHKRGRRPASCELCQYQYHWHKKFKIRHWQFPQCSRKDKILHLLFVFSALLMITCASLTIMFFKQDKGTKVDLNQELTQSEIGNLVCGVLFFVAFFVAIYVEAKSHDTLYKLLVKFIHINQQWYIDEYEKKETAPVAV